MAIADNKEKDKQAKQIRTEPPGATLNANHIVQTLDFDDLEPAWSEWIDPNLQDGESRLMNATTATIELNPIAENILALEKKLVGRRDFVQGLTLVGGMTAFSQISHAGALSTIVNCETGEIEEVEPVISESIRPPREQYTVEIIKLTPEDLSWTPRRHYRNGKKQWLLATCNWGQPVPMNVPTDDWGMPIGHTNPRVFCSFSAPLFGFEFGNMFLNSSVEGRDGPNHAESIGKMTAIKMRKIQGDPSGVSCDPYTFSIDSVRRRDNIHYSYSTKQFRQVADGWDLTFTPFEYAMHIKPGYCKQPMYFQGTINGEQVEGFGGMDRMFGLEMYFYPLLSQRLFNFRNTQITFAGRNAVTGKYEYGWVFLTYDGQYPKNGPPLATFGAFHREGEDPVFSDNIEIVNLIWGTREWPNKAKAVMPREATFRFAGKEIYVKFMWDNTPLDLKRYANGQMMDPIRRFVALGLTICGVSETNGVWKEKDSPKFNLTWCTAETLFTYPWMV